MWACRLYTSAEGATELQDEIDETFTKTVANIALSTTSSLTDFLNGDNIMNYASLLLHELDNAVEDLDAAQLEVKGLSSICLLYTSPLVSSLGAYHERCHSSSLHKENNLVRILGR